MTELRGLAPTPSCFIDQRAQSAGNQVLKNTMATSEPPSPFHFLILQTRQTLEPLFFRALYNLCICHDPSLTLHFSQFNMI